MTRFFLIVFCVVLLAACKPGIPKDIVQPAEMEKILFDIHVIDGYVSSIPTPDSAKKVSAPIYKGILKKYGIDSATHAKSMSYYYKHPDLLSKMYDRISGKMSKARDEEVKRQEKEHSLKAKKEVEAIPADTPKQIEQPRVDTLKEARLNKRKIKTKNKKLHPAI